MARVNALFRRMKLEKECGQEKNILQELSVIRCHDFLLDMQGLQLSLQGINAVLTPSEFVLMRALMREPGRVFPREELQGIIKDARRTQGPRAIDEHMRKLRKKIQTIGGSSMALPCIRGVGYKFE